MTETWLRTRPPPAQLSTGLQRSSSQACQASRRQPVLRIDMRRSSTCAEASFSTRQAEQHSRCNSKVFVHALHPPWLSPPLLVHQRIPQSKVCSLQSLVKASFTVDVCSQLYCRPSAQDNTDNDKFRCNNSRIVREEDFTSTKALRL